MAGLDDLFVYGAVDFARLLGATSDWRRAVPDSTEADLVEIMIYEAWAWRARGFGGAGQRESGGMAVVHASQYIGDGGSG